MAICPRCGKRFDADEVSDYIGEKFGYDVMNEIQDDNGILCDSCSLSIYYADHPENEDEIGFAPYEP